MKKDDFFALFRLKLTERGINETAASRIADNFLKRLDDEDENMIEAVVDVSEIDQFTDEYIEYMRMRQKLAEQQKAKQSKQAQNNNNAPQNAQKSPTSTQEKSQLPKMPRENEIFADSQASTVVFDKPVSGQIVDNKSHDEIISAKKSTDEFTAEENDIYRSVSTSHRQNADSYNSKTHADEYIAEEDTDYGGIPENYNNVTEDAAAFENIPEPTQTGKAVFIIGAIITLPVTLAFAAAALGLFVAVFAALAGMIILSIAAVVGGVAAGAVVAFVGVIYGITQIVAGLGPIGAYEIGIGLIITGIIMFGGILLYNFAVRFLPWVIKKVALLFGVCVQGVKKLVYIARKECYKL